MNRSLTVVKKRTPKGELRKLIEECRRFYTRDAMRVIYIESLLKQGMGRDLMNLALNIELLCDKLEERLEKEHDIKQAEDPGLDVGRDQPE